MTKSHGVAIITREVGPTDRFGTHYIYRLIKGLTPDGEVLCDWKLHSAYGDTGYDGVRLMAFAARQRRLKVAQVPSIGDQQDIQRAQREVGRAERHNQEVDAEFETWYAGYKERKEAHHAEEAARLRDSPLRRARSRANRARGAGAQGVAEEQG